jgi:hypothetical protein
MLVGFLHIAVLVGIALALAGCGFADVRSPVPEFMRAKEADPVPPEPPPDVKRLVHDQLDSMFAASSYPRDVRVSPPHHEVVGPGWTACVRADVNSATGKPISGETWRISIVSGTIVDRRRAGEDDNCENESYEPI